MQDEVAPARGKDNGEIASRSRTRGGESLARKERDVHREVKNCNYLKRSLDGTERTHEKRVSVQGKRKAKEKERSDTLSERRARKAEHQGEATNGAVSRDPAQGWRTRGRPRGSWSKL